MIRKLRKREVAARYGNVHPRTVDRWLLDPELKFPRPMHVGRAALWDETELEVWERERAKPASPIAE
jgi:predicted DNA-binding transcriptional regulator AlpA